MKKNVKFKQVLIVTRFRYIYALYIFIVYICITHLVNCNYMYSMDSYF